MNFVGIDKLSLLDYEDKISCVLFSKTCNFRCPFCHNGLTVLESEESISFDEIITYLKSRKGVLDAVVVSGGEPTLMPDLKEKIEVIKKLGFLVKLDTNGTNPLLLKELIDEKLIDYVAMDIKNSEEKYLVTTDCKCLNMDAITQSISIIMNSGIDYEFRTTLVKEFHDEQSIKNMANLIQGSKKLYLQKFVEREGCIKKGLHEVEEVLANQYKSILSQFIESVELRGY
jgi:pyruvate formate lyase activating enzyme